MNQLKLIIVFLSFGFATIFGQIKIQKYLTTEDGLISNQIFSLYQDSKGYLWIGTANGLSRWDGLNFKNYSTQDDLASSFIFDIVEGKDGKIYFATYGGGISYLENDSIHVINTSNGLSNNWISKFYLRKNGELLVVGQYNLSKLVNGKTEKILELDDKPRGTIWTVLESKDQKLFLGTHNGLKIFSNDSLQIFKTKDGLANDTVWSIAEDKNGLIYLGTNNGISKFKDGKFTTLKNRNQKISTIVPSIYVSSENTIYYGTTNGVIVEENNKLEFLSSENGLNQNDIWAITEDKNGTIYFGSKDYGINIYFPNKIENVEINKLSGSKNILSIYQSKNGKYFFGTDNGLLISKNSDYHNLISHNAVKNNLVKIIHETIDQKILLGAEYSFGFLTEKNFQEFSLKNSIKNFNRIYSIQEVSKDKFIVGAEYGLFLFENNEFTRLKAKNEQPPAFVKSITTLPDSTIVFATHGDGVALYKNDKIEFVDEENGLTNSVINSLYVNKDNLIFVGTDQGGLNIIKNNIVVDTIKIEDGLLSNTILGIVEDDYENLYLLTPRGVNIIKFYAGEPFIRELTKQDGIISNNLNSNSVFKDNSGNIWFGTTDGLTKYNPKYDKMNPIPPSIYITKLEIFNKDYPLKEFIKNNKLSYNQNYLRIYYSGIDLPNTDKIIYKYKLLGVDQEWISTNDNNIQCTNLDDGNYTFEIKARNEWGFWSEPAKLSFVINPAWWETWWFYTLTVILIGSLIAFIASYRYRNLLAVEKIRTKISADLHDSIGSGLSEITILSGLLQINPNIEDLQSGFKSISVTARSLVGNMSDIVWLVNPAKDSLKDLLLRLQDSYQEVFAQANISFKILGIENIEEIHLPLTYRQHLFLLFKEAINNSLKYSDCAKMELTIETKGKNLKIEFTDDGKGFDINEKSSGNGLTNMKERAKAIGGVCGINSEFNNGTRISFAGKLLKS